MLTLDNDNDSKPDVLDFDGTEQLHALNSAESLDAAIPFMVWYDALPSFESADTITAQLTAGTDYTLEFSRNFTDSLGARMPHFEVYDPDGVILSQDIFTLSLYPSENPAVICYTFTPQTSGLHSIIVSNANPNLSADIDTASVLFVYEEMHNEEGENGYPTCFKLSDNANTVSVRDIIQLRKIILEANPNYIDYLAGKTTAVGEINDDSEEFDNWVSVMKSNAGVDDEGRVTGGLTASAKVIPDIVNSIPYDERYSLGKGLMSTSDIATFDSAIKTEYLNIPVPDAKTGSTLFKYSYISSAEDYEREISAKTELSFSYNAVKGGASAAYSNSFKFGLTSITFMIHYEELEGQYRELTTDNCELKTDALNILNQGSEQFRSNYGDYFVAGYQYGGVYNAFITITTETTEQTSDIEAAINGSYNQGVAVDANFAATFKNAVNRNNASVNVEVRTAGANDNLPDTQVLTGANAIDTVVSQLSRNNLAKAFTPASYMPVKVRLKRYYTLNGVREKLSRSMPFTTDHWSNIGTLNSELVAVRGLYNSVAAIPSTNINGNARTGYLDRFNAISSRLDTAFYENASQVSNTIKEARTLRQDLQALMERYIFYRMLVSAQNIEPRGNFPRPGFVYSGYESCTWSNIVQGDMNAGSSNWQKWDYYIGGNRTWSPSYTAAQKNGSGEAIFYFIRVWCGGYEDQRHFNNSPAVGKKNISLTFQRGSVHEGHWTVLRKSMRFNSTLYPFNGLQQ